MLATYIGKENVLNNRSESTWLMLIPNKEYNIFIEGYDENNLISVYIFNKKGTKLGTRIFYKSLSSVRKEWKLAEKNDYLISQCLTTFS